MEQSMDTILVVEDDQDIADLLTINLQEIGLTVEHCLSGEAALEKLGINQYDLVMLDVMLPGISGLDVCRQLRMQKPEQVILMVTSRDSEMDRVLGLELGADDYMTKPFSVRELQARVRSQLRRVHLLTKIIQQQLTKQPAEQYLTLGTLQIDSMLHLVTLNGKNVELTSTEFDLLFYFASHPEQVFSREQLLSSVWGYHHSGYEHTVNSHINRLRNKVERNSTKPEIVQTVWGVGYKLCRQGVAA
ncbi:MAG: two-component system alkaline phosphatase synthesis response regulator PhoP [Cognaticolwellia sp.]|jgi:two-component system alkaline phosphatase synthesis response regulator PhoP